jgi:hypothetical protein
LIALVMHPPPHPHTYLRTLLLATKPPPLPLPEFNQSELADALWLLEIEFGNSPEKDKLYHLAKNANVTKEMAKMRWEAEMLEKTGIVPNAAAWRKKEVRVQTSVL